MLIEAMNKMFDSVLDDIHNNMIIGLGSGSTIAGFIQKLSEYIKKNEISITVIPSSLQILSVAENFGLQIGCLSERIDLVIDGVDLIDKNFFMIKGGGGALLKEKILMDASDEVFILCNEKKFVDILNKPIPIEVNPFARTIVAMNLKKLGGYPKLRILAKGYPYITENRNIIFDVDFGLVRDPSKMEKEIKLISGVIEVGIFTNKVDKVFKANKDKSVEIFYPNR
jgi:ribose 5-phosphate isomerase A